MFHCSGTLGWLGAFLHASTLKGTTVNGRLLNLHLVFKLRMGPALTLRCKHPGIWSHLKSGSLFPVFKPALVYICQDNGSQPTGHPKPEEQPRNVLQPQEGCSFFSFPPL